MIISGGAKPNPSLPVPERTTAIAFEFDQKEVEQDRFVAIASEGTEIASSEEVEPDQTATASDNTRQYEQYAEILKAWRDRILELRNQ